MSTGAATMENSRDSPQKIKNRITTWSSNPTSGYICKKLKSLSQSNICIPLFSSALFTIAKTWKQPKWLSTNEWIKKMWCIYTIYKKKEISHKKKEIQPFAKRWIGIEGILLNEMSDTERQILYDLTYMWNLKKNWTPRSRECIGGW